jgi:hypothetical protein
MEQALSKQVVNSDFTIQISIKASAPSPFTGLSHAVTVMCVLALLFKALDTYGLTRRVWA